MLPTDVAWLVKTYAHMCIVGVRLKRVKTKTREFPLVRLKADPTYVSLVSLTHVASTSAELLPALLSVR